MKILVTGGAGYIGSHTVLELANAGHTPVIVDNFANAEPNYLSGLHQLLGFKPAFYAADVTQQEAVEAIFEKEGNIDGVIHFAAFKSVGESVREPLMYYRNNIGSQVTILQAMKKYGVKNFVFSSSCTVYGQPEVLPVTEDSPVQPAESPYGNTKQISEEIMKDLLRSGAKMKMVSLRYFNPIGAHPTALLGETILGVPNYIVPFITQTAIGKRDILRVFGKDYKTPDGTAIRDYLHVVDLAKAHVAAVSWLDQQPGDALYDYFNIGTGKGTSVKQAIEAFETATGVKVNHEYVDRRPGDVEQVWADVTKATNVLGWKAELSIEEAMRDAWIWEKAITPQA